jgi:DNA-binding MarR family transcriptional regulator
VREILETNALREVTGIPLTTTQLRLLSLASRGKRHHVQEVAEFLGVSPPAITKNIDKLERFGLVSRSSLAGDRRATMLEASAKGRRLVRSYERRKAKHLEAALAPFRPDEIGQFAELLRRFSLALLALDSSGETGCLRCAAEIDADCPVIRIQGGCPCAESDGDDLNESRARRSSASSDDPGSSLTHRSEGA